MKMGLEKEFFVVRDGKAQSLASEGLKNFHIPYDECGWLAEARGEPFGNIVDAVFSLKAAVYKIQKNVNKVNGELKITEANLYSLSDEPVMKVDRSTKLQCARSFSKGVIKYQNLYGHQCHRNSLSEATAGVHISFTCEQSYHVRDSEYIKYNANFDWPQIFIKLDKAFADEIKAAKRRPGFYELKENGRVEYRSLPSNVNLDKVIEILQPYGYTY